MGRVRVDLSGTWYYRLDKEDRGIEEQWFRQRFTDQIYLPGSLQQYRIGDEVSVNTPWTGSIVDRSYFTQPEYAEYRRPGNIKVPFWLQPDTYYKGVAWYQRVIQVPVSLAGKRLLLFLERPHWETKVWLDDTFVGSNQSLSTPHVYELGTDVRPGEHLLTIRVDNRLVVDVGINSHSVSDHTQGNWNGIVGRLELVATPRLWIERLDVFPQVKDRSLFVKGSVKHALGPNFEQTVAQKGQNSRSNITVSLSVEPIGILGESGRETGVLARTNVSINLQGPAAEFTAVLRLGEQVKLWDEFHPYLYKLRAQIKLQEQQTDSCCDEVETEFGFREVSTEGTQFTINGRKFFVRGTLECCIFPLTGHPPTDLDSWLRICKKAKAFGLNTLRFHSWCPPEAAFQAAARVGLYLHVEASSWANSSTTLGDGKPVDQWIYQETERILQFYGNYPSFVFMAYGNEPGGANHRRFLAEYVKHFKSIDPRRLWTSAAGWPELPENQWHCVPQPRIQAWGAGLRSRINANPPETLTDYREFVQKRSVPVVAHEIGQWCVYPNFDEIPKYKGYLKPKNLEIFRDFLAKNGMLDQARLFLMASGKLQVLCYKEEIESQLRTPGMGGFELLQLHDFPGQGTALVGVLDPFWDEKGYVTAAEFSRFCGPTVALLRMPQRVYTSSDRFQATVQVAHFGPTSLRAVPVRWVVRRTGKTETIVLQGELGTHEIPIGNEKTLGQIVFDLSPFYVPSSYNIELQLVGVATNDWNFWVYPDQLEDPPIDSIYVTERLDKRALEYLENGKTVLWSIPPKQVAGDGKGKVALGFSSIFWNTAWTRRQAPHTLGILCNPNHPLFSQFPTEFHSDWHWWYIVRNAGAMILTNMPSQLRPLIQVIDDWFTARKLGLLFEARCMRGNIVVCSIDLGFAGGEKLDPVRRQLRYSLLRYITSADFKPQVEVEFDQLLTLQVPASEWESLGLKRITASSYEPGYEPENVIDGDEATIWHSAWSGEAPNLPHYLEIEFERPVELAGITVLPRTDGNRNGWIKEYVVTTSVDAKTWEEVIKGIMEPKAERQFIRFPHVARGKFWRLYALSTYSSGPWASAAEIWPITASKD